MVQPKTPPLSIRIPNGLLAEIDGFAERVKLSRHAAILALLAQAIGAQLPTSAKWPAGVKWATDPDPVLPPPPAKAYRTLKINIDEPLRMPRAPIGSLAKKPKGKG